MFSFQQIRYAVTAVTSNAPGFPFGEGWAASRMAQLREAPEWQDFLGAIRTEALQAKNTPVSVLSFSLFKGYATDGNRQEYEKAYFNRRGRLLALVLTSVIDETGDYLETLQDLIWEICNEYTWCLPAHLPLDLEKAAANHWSPPRTVDLFAAETADALAETLLMVGESLNPVIKQRVLSEIERRIFQPVFDDPVHFWWESTSSNWASVCAGSVGMAALLLIKDRERLAGIIDRVIRSMESFLASYGEDGGCAEGVGYWGYGFGYYVYFAQMLYDYTGGVLDLLQFEKIRHMAEFPAGISLSNDQFINYSDAISPDMLPTGLVSKLNQRFGSIVPELKGIPPFHSDHCYRWATATRSILWTDTSLFHQATPARTIYFPDLGWIVDRRYAGETILAFSAKGGHNNVPHNHNDLGHFILHLGGESLLADLGSGLYTRQYFGVERYTILNNSSEGHSVPIINRQAQQAGSEYKATITRYEQQQNGLVFELDLTGAYDNQAAGLSRFIRTFQWNYEPRERVARLNLLDDFQFATEPDSLVENFISLHQPALNEDKGMVIWQAEKGRVEMHYEAEKFKIVLEVLQIQDHYGRSQRVFRVRLQSIKLLKQLTARFRFNLVPETKV